MRKKHILRTQFLGLVAAFAATVALYQNCGKEEESETMKVTDAIVMSRSSNNTGVTINSLSEGATPLVAGNYPLRCDIKYTTTRTTLAQLTDNASAYGASYLVPVIQSFNAPATGKLTSLELKVISGSGATQQFSVILYDALPNSAGAPFRVLASEIATATTVQQMITVPLTKPVDVTAGTTYFLMVRAPTSFVISWAVDTSTSRIVGDIYTSSNGGATWSLFSDKDLVFKVHVDAYSAPTYKYTYNGVSTPVYSTYPNHQQIAIDGGAAGFLKFTTSAGAPGGPADTAPTDMISVIQK